MVSKCNAFLLFRSNLGLSGIHQSLVSIIAGNLWEKMLEDGSTKYWHDQADWLSENRHLFEGMKSSAEKRKGVPRRNAQDTQPVVALPPFVIWDEATRLLLPPLVNDAASGNSSAEPCPPVLPFTFLAPSLANKHDTQDGDLLFANAAHHVDFPSHVPAEPSLSASVPRPRQDIFGTGHAIPPTSGERLPQPAVGENFAFQQYDYGSYWGYSPDPLIVKDGRSGQLSTEQSIPPTFYGANTDHHIADLYRRIIPSQANAPLPSYEQHIYDGAGSSGWSFAPSENTTPSDTRTPYWIDGVPAQAYSSGSEFY